MCDFIDKNQFIYERQFGFRAKHSTNHTLISTTDSAGGVFIDLKAFYAVNHDILCRNLHTMPLDKIIIDCKEKAKLFNDYFWINVSPSSMIAPYPFLLKSHAQILTLLQ